MASFQSVSLGLTKWFSLGNVVSGNGIFMDLKKVGAIVNRERPKNVTEIRSFLSLAGYYR